MPIDAERGDLGDEAAAADTGRGEGVGTLSPSSFSRVGRRSTLGLGFVDALDNAGLERGVMFDPALSRDFCAVRGRLGGGRLGDAPTPVLLVLVIANGSRSRGVYCWASSTGETICFPSGRGGTSSPKSTYDDMLVLGLWALPNEDLGDELGAESLVIDGRHSWLNEGLPPDAERFREGWGWVETLTVTCPLRLLGPE
jgi:hypothetical protein